jgi:SAM-dependent methyltransferase
MTKSLRFLGKVNDLNDAIVTVTLGQETVFEGMIAQDRAHDILFEVPGIPQNYTGLIPMTISISQGSLTMGEILINHGYTPNPRFTEHTKSKIKSVSSWSEKILILSEITDPEFSADQLEFLQRDDPAIWNQQEQLLYKHQCHLAHTDSDLWESSNKWSNVQDARQNVIIDGVCQTPQRDSAATGTWHWTVSAGQVLSYDLVISKIPSLRSLFNMSDNRGKYEISGMCVDLLIDYIPVAELNNIDAKILDIGIGRFSTGWHELSRKEIKGQKHGLDIAYHPAAEVYDDFVVADIQGIIPVEDNTYDAVLCSNVFQEQSKQLGMPESEITGPLATEWNTDCLDEILRIMRPGAVLVVTVSRCFWPLFKSKLQQLKSSNKIHVLSQRWEYEHDFMSEFLPTLMLMSLTKSQ